MNSTKEHILSSIIVTMSFIIIGISISYAYYENAIKGDPIEVGVNTANGLDITFTKGDIINTTGGLINDGNYENGGSMNNVIANSQFTSFDIVLPSSSAFKVEYDIFITDIKMTENFKSEYLKWALYDGSDNPIQDDAGNNILGDFSGAINLGNCETIDGYNICDFDSIHLLTSNNSIKEVHAYRLYIWLSNHPAVNQIDLLNGKLSAKVGVKAKSTAS